MFNLNDIDFAITPLLRFYRVFFSFRVKKICEGNPWILHKYFLPRTKYKEVLNKLMFDCDSNHPLPYKHIMTREEICLACTTAGFQDKYGNSLGLHKWHFKTRAQVFALDWVLARLSIRKTYSYTRKDAVQGQGLLSSDMNFTYILEIRVWHGRIFSLH